MQKHQYTIVLTDEYIKISADKCYCFAPERERSLLAFSSYMHPMNLHMETF